MKFGAPGRIRTHDPLVRSRIVEPKAPFIINKLRHGGPRIASALSATEPD